MIPTSAKDANDMLARIEASGKLGERSRLKDILRYVVLEEVAGRGDRISGYSIGVDVLGRDADFDSGSDSIVRTEVNRLRQALELYYGTDGQADPIKIDLPKGSYRPRFSSTAPQRSRLMPAVAFLVGLLALAGVGWFALGPGSSTDEAFRSGFDGPRLAVVPFVPIQSEVPVDAIANGVSFELITDLTQYSWLAVSRLPMPTQEFAATAPIADYVLSGTVSVEVQQLILTLTLTSGPDGDVVWTKRLTRDFSPLRVQDLQRDLALEVASELGSDSGIVPSLVLSHRSPLDEVSLESLTCLMGIYGYWDSPSVEEHARLRACLLAATDSNPGYAEAWAGLAFMYIDEGREDLNPRPGADAWADADQALERALAAAPLSSLALNAAMTLAVARPDPDYVALRRYGEQELSLRPNSAFTLANFGAKLALNAGDWKKGMLLHAHALELDKQPPSWVHFATAYQALLFGSDEDLSAASQDLQPRGSKPVELLRAISAQQAGDDDLLDESIALLKQSGVTSRAEAISYVKNRRFHADLEQRLIEYIGQLPDF